VIKYFRKWDQKGYLFGIISHPRGIEERQWAATELSGKGTEQLLSIPTGLAVLTGSASFTPNSFCGFATHVSQEIIIALQALYL